MTFTSTLCALLAGLGLFFIGVRGLSANLVPLAGRRARAAFAATLRGPFSIAFSGMAAGLLTQSSIAVSWVVLGFLRAGVLAEGPAFMAPAWSNVGAALLPLLVAINTEVAAEFVIGVVGFAIYFRLDRTDRLRHGMEAALGAAMLLFGMHIVAGLVGQLRETMTQDHWLLLAQRAPWLLAVLGAGLALATQSSSVAAALGVAMVSAGLLTLPGALPMIAGANAASVLTNLSRLRVEGIPGRIVFTLQAVQKAAGTVLLAAVVVLVALQPAAAPGFAGRLGIGAGAQIALLFMLAQLAGALVTAVGSQPIARLVRRLTPARRGRNAGAAGLSAQRSPVGPAGRLGPGHARAGAADRPPAAAAGACAGRTRSRRALRQNAAHRRKWVDPRDYGLSDRPARPPSAPGRGGGGIAAAIRFGQCRRLA